jgi:arabinofuranosyltransferase
MAATWSRPRCWAVVAIAAAVFILHARSIDAVCDDAFISLRYARNLVDHGAPVYNLGERVEGYTSPLWMLLSVAPLALGIEGSKVLSLMGLLGGVALVAAVWRLWTVVAPARPVPGFVVLGLVVASTPLAAWSSSGLETPAFAAMIALSVAEAAVFVGEPTRARGYVAGGVIALTTLLRPEGALIGAVAFVCLALNRGTRLQLLPFLLAAAAPVSVFVLWRLWYYGELLPNTFFAKLSAAPWRRIQVGLRYSFFTVSELGFAFSTLLVLSAIVAPWKAPATRIIRPIIPIYVAYVLYAGGDFFDLFRFFVPILPLLLVSLVASALALESYLGMTTRAWMVLLGLAAPAYLASQISLRSRALQIEEPERAGAGIEPLGWTKRYAVTWADTGRFLRAHARAGDSMADAAAGAAPYYSGLPNLDLLGLNDAEVARHGLRLGSRPGHQRLARLDYVLSRRPTYLMLTDCIWPWPGSWADSGYLCAEARAPSRAGGEEEISFLVDAVRGQELADSGVVRLRAN